MYFTIAQKVSKNFAYFCKKNCHKELKVVVAQLVEWSLPIPQVCSSNPVISKHLY